MVTLLTSNWFVAIQISEAGSSSIEPDQLTILNGFTFSVLVANFCDWYSSSL